MGHSFKLGLISRLSEKLNQINHNLYYFKIIDIQPIFTLKEEEVSQVLQQEHFKKQ